MSQVTPRKLYRSRQQRMIYGIAGGVAEYFHVDPTLIRLLFVLLLIPSGPFAILIYWLLRFVIPEAPGS